MIVIVVVVAVAPAGGRVWVDDVDGHVENLVVFPTNYIHDKLRLGNFLLFPKKIKQKYPFMYS